MMAIGHEIILLFAATLDNRNLNRKSITDRPFKV